MRLRRSLAPLLVTLSLIGCASSGAHADEADRIARALALEPGMTVGDVGAGEGEWAEALARVVGASGHVYATEVDEDLVDEIRETLEATGLDNGTAVLGNQRSTGLEADCCDAILMRMVYHHFEDPEPMRAEILQALRPGARLAIIDIRPQRHWRELDGVPDRGGHGIEPNDLIDEMSRAGFELVERIEDWNSDEDRYCVVFRRASGDDPPN